MQNPNTPQPVDNSNRPVSPFEAIKRSDERGEYWCARDLMPLMGYGRWQTFEIPLRRAIKAAENTGIDVTSQFTRSRNLAPRAHGGGNDQDDYQLSRQAAYLVAMNGDPNKPEVAAAQAYFAVRTHQAEVIQQEHDELPEWAQQQIATIRRVGKIEVEQELQRERINAVEGRLDGIEGHHDWFSALGYAKTRGLPTERRAVAELGRIASKLCKRDGVVPDKAQHPLYGEVGVYPKHLLDEAAATVGGKVA